MEKKIFKYSLLFPFIIVLVFWIVWLIDLTPGVDFTHYGILPRQSAGLKGILFSPFIHSGFNHLVSNTVPFFVLTFALVYFYRWLSYRIFFLMFIISGALVWLTGRDAWHIGASGLVYALAAFHLVSGFIRMDLRLLTISVIVVFIYGGMIWGIFPFNSGISWEGHLWGAASGVGLAFYYKNYNLRREKFDWENEDENDETEEAAGDDAENENVFGR
jgi:membrane associated rhomboid family serine protease